MSISAVGSRWRRASPYLLSVLRIVAAFLFVQYGTSKWFAFPAPLMPGGGTVSLTSQAGVAAVLEVVGGGLLLIGLFTRPIAFVLAGEMAFAYFLQHAPRGFWPIVNQGIPAIVFCFVWLYISAAGAGPLSVDAMIGRGRTRRGGDTASILRHRTAA